MTIQEIDKKINYLDQRVHQIKLYVNTCYPKNFDELIKERLSYKKEIGKLLKQKERQQKLERICLK